jgi:hypothetical protein
MVGRGHTKETVGLLNVNSIYLNTLFDGRSWSYQRNRGVVKCKLYTFKHPLRSGFFGMTTTYHRRGCLNV